MLFIQHFSYFLIQAYDINLPLIRLLLHPKSFDMSHCHSHLSLSFDLSFYFSLTQLFFSSVLFDFYVYVDFPHFLQLISNFKVLWSNIPGMISILNFLTLVLYSNIWSILSLRMFHGHQRRMYNLVFWYERLCKCLLCPFDLICHLRLIFPY